MLEDNEYTLNDFNFSLPEELIAQYPVQKREDSRLFMFDRKSDEYKHFLFKEIYKFFKEGDVLVFNNAKVIPARIYFNRKSGGLVEIVLVQQLSKNKWLTLCNKTKKMKPGEELSSVIHKSCKIKIISRQDDYLEIETSADFNEDLLKKIGEIPLPPYIKRKANQIDNNRYQTVYAEKAVAAASPTAGLHFSRELMDKIIDQGVITTFLTLHVSWGTFQPVRDNDLSKHKMHKEKFNFPVETADEVNRARREGRRVIAVGTTSLRVLESTFIQNENIPQDGVTDIFIYPPKKVKSIDALITNFHTPFSTLLMLVSAFAGHEKIMKAYQAAVNHQYRFFSYGDSMFIY